MEREIKFQVLLKDKIIGIERLTNHWEWMHYELNPDKSEMWTRGVFGNSPDLIRRQYIELKDKNGKEIYHRDIVTLLGDMPTEIKFKEGGFGYDTKLTHGDFIHIGGNYHFKWNNNQSPVIEIIGNAFQNPELLEEL